MKWDGSNFLIDSAPNYLGTDIDEYSLSPISDSRFNLSVTWNRRNGIGTIIGSDTLVAMRTSLSEDEHTFGLRTAIQANGRSRWHAETTRHNAGSGTIFLRWGTSVPSIVSKNFQFTAHRHHRRRRAKACHGHHRRGTI